VILALLALLQQLVQALVLTVAQPNGQQQLIVVANLVVKVVQHVLMPKPVLLVRLDMKAMELEDVDNAMREHTLLLVDLVLLALLVNGPLQQVLPVQIVSLKEDVMRVLQQLLVQLVRLDIKLMEMEDVQLVALDIILLQMVLLVLLVLVVNILMQDLSFVYPVQVIVLHVLRLLNVALAILDMDIHLDYALNVMQELIQQVEPILVNHAVLVCGQMQDPVLVQIVSLLLDVNFVLLQLLVPSVLLDIKVMEMEDVLHAVLELILLLVDLVLLVPMVNGQMLLALLVQIVSLEEDAILVVQQLLVLYVLPDIKQMEMEDAQLVMLDIILQQMVLLVLTALVVNIQIQHQVLVQVVVVVVILAHQCLPALFVALDMAIYLDNVLNVMEELIQQVEPAYVNHVLQELGLMQELVSVQIVFLLDVKHVLQQLNVQLVLQDIKVMEMEDVLNAQLELILLLLVDLVLLVLVVYGQTQALLLVQLVQVIVDFVQQLLLVPHVSPNSIYQVVPVMLVQRVPTLFLVLHHAQFVFPDVLHALVEAIVQAVQLVGTKIPLDLAINAWQTLILPQMEQPIIVLHALLPNTLMLAPLPAQIVSQDVMSVGMDQLVLHALLAIEKMEILVLNALLALILKPAQQLVKHVPSEAAQMMEPPLVYTVLMDVTHAQIPPLVTFVQMVMPKTQQIFVSDALL